MVKETVQTEKLRPSSKYVLESSRIETLGPWFTNNLSDTAELNMTFTEKRFNIREKLGRVVILKLLIISSVPVDHASQSTA